MELCCSAGRKRSGREAKACIGHAARVVARSPGHLGRQARRRPRRDCRRLLRDRRLLPPWRAGSPALNKSESGPPTTADKGQNGGDSLRGVRRGAARAFVPPGHSTLRPGLNPRSLVFLLDLVLFFVFFAGGRYKAASSRLLYVVAAAPRRALVALANSHDQRLHAVISFASAARTSI